MVSQSVVVYADGHDCPVTPPRYLSLGNTAVIVGWVPEARPWLSGDIRGWTLMGGYGTAGPIRDGKLRYIPVRLSAARHALTALNPDIAIVPGVRRGSDLAFGRSVGWALSAIEAAPRVVVEVDDTAEDLGAPLIPGRIDRVVIGRRPMTPPAHSAPDETDESIARNVLQILPQRATLQFGPGAIADVIVRSIDRPVSIWSGLLTDAVATLDSRGLLIDQATGAYAYGGAPIVELCKSGRARLAPVSETHDIARIAALPGFVAINTALQVGLDGSVNIERVGGRLVTGMGGHPDFCTAAARAPDGTSVIALRSTHRGASTIVRQVETVSTPRCDVDVVVTEYGVADLRAADDDERAHRLASIAAPTARDSLRKSGLAAD